MPITAPRRTATHPIVPPPSLSSAERVSGSGPATLVLPDRFDVAEQIALLPESTRSIRHTLLDRQGHRLGLVTHNPQVGIKVEDAIGRTVAVAIAEGLPGQWSFAVHDGEGRKLGTLMLEGQTGQYRILDPEGRSLAHVEDRKSPLGRGRLLVLISGGEERTLLTRYPLRGLVWDRWKVYQRLPGGVDPRLWVMIPVLYGSGRGRHRDE